MLRRGAGVEVVVRQWLEEGVAGEASGGDEVVWCL